MSQTTISYDSDNFYPRKVYIDDETDSEKSEINEEDTEDEMGRERPNITLPPEYWHIQKIVKLIKSGNQTSTVVALCCLKDYDLTNEINQFAIQDLGGLEILINLLETEDIKSIKTSALEVLADISTNESMQKSMVNLGIIPQLVKNLNDVTDDVRILAALTIHHIGVYKKARKDIRHNNGIQLLVGFLDVNDITLKTPKAELSETDIQSVNVAIAALKALWSTASSRKNIEIIYKSGGVPLLARLISSVHVDAILPAMGTLSLCTTFEDFQLAVQTEGMIKNIVAHLINETDEELRAYCCEIICNCCGYSVTRDLVREAGGLDVLIKVISDANAIQNKKLLAAATGAIWRVAKSKENVERFENLKAVEILVGHLVDVNEDEKVLANVAGALGEFVKFQKNRDILRRINGIPYLIQLLNYTYEPLLENLTVCLRECAADEESMMAIEENDGVRLVWSLLKNASTKIQASAAWCLVPCIKYAKDSGEMVRSFVGGLELIVNLLESENLDVLSSVCAATAEIAKDKENLAIISDHGAVPRLVDLVKTEDEKLREHLAAAIASCCSWGNNCKLFGRLGAITPLVGFMFSRNTNVKRTTAQALYQLSFNKFNAITMHESNVVVFLLEAVGSPDYELQDAAAGCLANIRKLALDAETRYLINQESSDEDINHAA